MNSVVQQILTVRFPVGRVHGDGTILVPEPRAGAAQADIREIAVAHRLRRYRAVLQGTALAELIPFVIEEEELLFFAVIDLGNSPGPAHGPAVEVLLEVVLPLALFIVSPTVRVE